MCNKIMTRPLAFPSKYKISATCQNFISRLLDRIALTRLGCGLNGVETLKSHEFFEGINWDDLLAKKVPVPFLPKVTDEIGDTRYFDKEFTKMPCRDSITTDVGAHKYQSSSRSGSSKSSAEYPGFSFSHQKDTTSN